MTNYRFNNKFYQWLQKDKFHREDGFSFDVIKQKTPIYEHYNLITYNIGGLQVNVEQMFIKDII